MMATIGRSKILIRGLLCAALSNVLTSAAIAAPETNAPCPAAANPASYSDPFLKSFRTLKQGTESWLFRDMDLKRAYGPRAPGYRSLHKLQQLLLSRGTRLVMVPIPGRPLIHPEYLGEINYDIERGRKSYSHYLEQLRDMDIVVPQIDSLFEQTQTKALFFARDHHWNHHGARTIARLTAYAIKDEKISGIKRKKFTSYSVGGDHNDGSLQRAALELCKQSYPKEPFKLYQTIPKSESSDDLFAELPEPQIILVGTSNSQGRLKFNFDGFLTHYIGATVNNKAKSGGGFGGALKDYLSSEDFKQSPPKILIWEIPGYYSLNEAIFFEDLLAVLGGQS